MNLKKIILKEVNDFDWVADIEPNNSDKLRYILRVEPKFQLNHLSDKYNGHHSEHSEITFMGEHVHAINVRGGVNDWVRNINYRIKHVSSSYKHYDVLLYLQELFVNYRNTNNSMTESNEFEWVGEFEPQLSIGMEVKMEDDEYRVIDVNNQVTMEHIESGISITRSLKNIQELLNNGGIEVYHDPKFIKENFDWLDDAPSRVTDCSELSIGAKVRVIDNVDKVNKLNGLDGVITLVEHGIYVIKFVDVKLGGGLMPTWHFLCDKLDKDNIILI